MTARTGTTPGESEARFPGLDVVAQAPGWDDVTRAVVLARLAPTSELRFFTPDEARIALALVDRLLGQDDEPRVPVLPAIDDRLHAKDGDGYRYADLPDDGEAWRRSLAGLECDARDGHGAGFAELSHEQQMALLEAIRLTDGEWRGLPAGRVFSLWMRYACAAFYAHPWAWNEIGFNGPAYPRGYANLGLDRREHWERPERDADDPMPWIERAEAAKQTHADRLVG